MNHLDWLVDRSFQDIERRDYDWAVIFSKESSLVVSCLWRLLEGDRICVTSEDDGQQFGLDSQIDAAEELRKRLRHVIVEAVHLQSHTLDLEIRCATGHLLQIIPISSGYEAWVASNAGKDYIAVGGGELTVISR